LAPNNATLKKIIDLHGIRDALTTKNNAVRSAVIDAIQTGEMNIVRSVSEELKAIDPIVYKDFQNIKPKKYTKITVGHISTAALLTQTYGASILGSVPPPERFEVLALCHAQGLSLVTSGKAQKECKAIAKKCKMNGTAVLGIDQI